ncbi:MAG: DnaJ domain-containing protein [Gemmatimonadetes bacterium]|nr:DnaJ domain-containing protein [Gemmatimonadota bacterium]
MAMLSQALRMTKDCRLGWRVFLEHRTDVLRRCVTWRRLGVEEIAELCEDCFAYRDIEIRYNSALTRLVDSLEELTKNESTRDLAEDFASTRDSLELDLDRGIRDDPNEAIHAFEMLAQLAESAAHGEESSTDEASLEELVSLHLSVLELSPDSSEELAARTWRKLISQWHPDRHPPERRAEAERRTMEINEAYTALRRLWTKTQSA